MKYFLAFTLLVFTQMPTLANSPLKLSGSVVDISVGCAYEKPYAAVSLLMQFYNAGNEPVIVLQPYYHFQTRVLFSGDLSNVGYEKLITGDALSFDHTLEDPYGVPTADDFDPLPYVIQSWRESLKGKVSKPVNGWKVIAPGRYLEFRGSVLVRNGFRFEKISGENAAGCISENFQALPEHSSFKIEYFYSLKKYKDGEDLFLALRDAWRPHGNLLLNADGNIFYRSDSITIPNDEQAR